MNAPNLVSPILTVSGLTKRFGDHVVLKHLDLQVNQGEIYGFIGHNGAGKSTTMKLLLGLLAPDGGTIHRGFGPRQQVGYLPESPEFFPYMTPWQYLDYIGGTGGLKGYQRKTKNSELLDLVGLLQAKDRPIGGFSRGMKQRLGLAVALYHDPLLLLLDEPSSALDPLGRKEVISILENLKAQGKTIFLSTHILDDIERICDRIGVLHKGVLAVEGPLTQLLQNSGTHSVCLQHRESSSAAEISAFHTLILRSLPVEITSMASDTYKITPIGVQPMTQDLLLERLLVLCSQMPQSLYGITRQSLSLEDLYMKVVKT